MKLKGRLPGVKKGQVIVEVKAPDTTTIVEIECTYRGAISVWEYAKYLEEKLNEILKDFNGKVYSWTWNIWADYDMTSKGLLRATLTLSVSNKKELINILKNILTT